MDFGFFLFVEAIGDDLVDGEFGTEKVCTPEGTEIVDADDEGIVHEILVASFGHLGEVLERLIHIGNILRDRGCDDAIAESNVGVDGSEILVLIAK